MKHISNRLRSEMNKHIFHCMYGTGKEVLVYYQKLLSDNYYDIKNVVEEIYQDILFDICIKTREKARLKDKA